MTIGTTVPGAAVVPGAFFCLSTLPRNFVLCVSFFFTLTPQSAFVSAVLALTFFCLWTFGTLQNFTVAWRRSSCSPPMLVNDVVVPLAKLNAYSRTSEVFVVV